MNIYALIGEVKKHNPVSDPHLLEQVYDFAGKVHKAQKAESDSSYIQHALRTAMILAELGLDREAVSAALLHDVLTQTAVSKEDIKNRFGEQIAKLVDGSTQLSLVTWEKLDKERIAGLQKMFLAMVDDVRVVIIKLAEQLDKIRHLPYLPAAEQEKFAGETLFIFAPLAGKLGIWSLKRELEDQSFKCLEPEKYSEIVHFLADSKENREKRIGETIRLLENELAGKNIPAEVTGRPKHIYSIHKKMEATQREFSAIYDVRAVRILVGSVQDCYAALDTIQRLWTPVSGEFDDYIAKPKRNEYRSLHTAVIGPQNKPLEIQIRTHEMHRVAEYGIASHWRYKDTKAFDTNVDEKVNYLRILLEWQQELTESKEYFRSLKVPPFAKYVYVLTPKGDIFDLPAGATPLDFAYRIHTDLGHRCRGAKVNGKLVSLDYRLRSGDRVEIVKSKERRPSRDWLNPQLGYVYTPRVKQKIRQWFRIHEREANVSRGRDVLERVLKQLRIRGKNFEEIAPLFGYKKSGDLLEAIGYGEIRSNHLKTKLNRLWKEIPDETPFVPVVSSPKEKSRILVEGAKDFLTRTAQCCRPLPGDKITGYVTKGRGVTVHRADCHNILRQKDRERLMDVGWGKGRQLHDISIRVECMDAKKILKEMAVIVEMEDARMLSSNLNVLHKEPISVINVLLEIGDVAQLNQILNKIKGLPNVYEAKKKTH
ncbi:MAG: bifunctional (p)ppGpp synthetase/guanosine-3',5'-bis(diphosphate) 3'-pyrophosphohydrolase [Candidatus Aminicenantes bacterium]|nr:bifunctional (p)ppGpp synthetase/guanosine-3',5'-bis(diphosphate) 3'-pyrophosphohydrolase [Candidatus Aminicenantes bacterium]